MDLIIEEQRASYGAYIRGEQWDEPQTFENTLDRFIDWAMRARQSSGIRLESCDDPGKLTFYLYHLGSKIDSHRLTITCENAADRDELASRLMSMFNIDIEPPKAPEGVDLRTGDAIEDALLNDPAYS